MVFFSSFRTFPMSGVGVSFAKSISILVRSGSHLPTPTLLQHPDSLQKKYVTVQGSDIGWTDMLPNSYDSISHYCGVLKV